MTRRVHALLLLCCLAWSCQAADSTAAMQQALVAERDRAAADLAATTADIEAQRRERLAAIDAARERIRERQAAVNRALRELDAVRAERSALQASERREQTLAPQLARRLASEGLAVDPRASTTDLLADWPHITAQVDARLAELDAALRIERHEATFLDRAGQPATATVWEWGAAQRLALGDTPATRGLLRRLDDGHWQVAGPHLDAALLAGPGRMAVDVTGRLAASDVQAGGVIALFRRAGPFAWPILAVALLGLAIVLDRCWLLWRWHTPRNLIDRLIADIDRPAVAQEHLHQRQTAPTTRILRAVLHRSDAPPADREQHAGAALVEAEMRLGRGLRLLAVLAAAAPLLGLLGTVTGMITSFRALDLGSGGNAGMLSAGIGEALLTTEFGLIVAVPLLIAHAIFARDAQRRRAQAESAAMRLLAALSQRPASGPDDGPGDGPDAGDDPPPPQQDPPASEHQESSASHRALERVEAGRV